ncbi:MAG: ankyrin repeat domain-containing protein [Pyrinomonadaceae bacterium MAG19_C2-C3]|nr:ankyrin repeat domain-containing protein [Pyrinomonadaceae bacterium MAG19_C2-C3]
MQALLEGADANAVGEKDVAVLNTAAEGKSTDVVKALLNAGAKVDNKRNPYSSALCRAVAFGRKENVEALLAKGAKVKVICDGDHGDSPLMSALLQVSISDMPDEFQASLKQESDDSEDEKQIVNDAFSQPRENFIVIARMLLERGADVNVIAKCDVGETALMYAAMSANVEMVGELLARGADANKGGSSALLSDEFNELNFEKSEWRLLPAISKSQTALVAWSEKTKKQREQIKDLLMKAGGKAPENDDEESEAFAEPQSIKLQNAADEVFDDAIESNDAKDFARLIEAYKSHSLGTKALPEALRKAMIFSRTELIKLMLERGVNPNTSTIGGRTPLMQAASNGNDEYVKMLLDAGADVNLVDDNGRTALDEAQSWVKSDERWLTTVELLKAHGAKSKSQQPQN